MEFELVPLHKNKHHKDYCVTLLNAVWPRSTAAREHSLNKSCDELPCCLVFRRTSNKEVVGYSQIVAVQGKQNACLFESVIIRDDLRGTGLGRKLMNSTEDFAKQLKFHTAYLSTHDKQGFYARLGYTECGPVISLGANACKVSDEFLQKLLGSYAVTNTHSSFESNTRTEETVDVKEIVCTASSLSLTSTESLSPPPCAGPPPPPPPPPPLPTRQTAKSNNQLSRHVIRMDPNATTWLQKSL